MDKSLHDLVENYTRIERKNVTRRRRPNLAAALRAAANCARRLCRVYPSNFGVTLNQIVQGVVHLPKKIVFDSKPTLFD